MPRRYTPACVAVLGFLLLGGPSIARDDVPSTVRSWLSSFITKIDAADRARRSKTDKTAGTVVVRVEVAADGSVRRPEIERSSGSRLLDQRAIDALRAVASFDPPPAVMLTPAGVTDLSFQLHLGR